MSTPTTRSFTSDGGGTPYEINDFVAAVRVQLNDLSVDEVTELTGGLEADLTDAVAEADSTLSQLYGDPAAYASELRAAAGLPPRGAGGDSRVAGPGLAVRFERSYVIPMREGLQSAIERLDVQPWWPGVRDFLIAIRPAWWVLRAWVVVEAFFLVVGIGGDGVVRGGFGGLVVLLAAIVLSVQLARHSPLPVTGQRVLVSCWNVGAVLLLLPVLFASTGTQDVYEESYGPPPTGLSINGDPVSNVFPYDSAGRPLSGVQLFDQEGRPLEISEDARSYYDEQSNEVQLVPGSPAGSAPQWNAYPLQQRRSEDYGNGEPGPIEPAPLPLAGVPSASEVVPSPGVSSSADPTESPTPSVSPSEAAPKSTSKSDDEDGATSK